MTTGRASATFRFLVSAIVLLDLWLVHQVLYAFWLADHVQWLYWAGLAVPAYLMGWAFTGKTLGTLAVGSTTIVLSVPLAILTVLGLTWMFGAPSSGRPDDDLVGMVVILGLSWFIWPVLLPIVVIALGALIGGIKSALGGWRTNARRVASFAGGFFAMVLVAVLAAPLSSQARAHRYDSPAYEPIDPSVPLLRSYIWGNYNDELKLFREAPNVAPDTYWIWSDAYLAAGEPPYDVPRLRKWTVLRGDRVPEEVFSLGSRVIELGGGVKTEEEDPSIVFEDWLEYGDRVLLAAIRALWMEDHERAGELLDLARQMWDGVGMRDKVYFMDGKYETYKTALYYYATGSEDARRVLASLQEKDSGSNRYGGMYTEYGSNGKPFDYTDTNIETTAITLLSLNLSHTFKQ